MPIVEIEITRKQNESIPNDLAASLANELGAILNSPDGTTWVKLHELQESHYAENNVSQNNIHPVFINIIKSVLPETSVLEKEVIQITKIVAKLCNRPPENIHIIYEPEGRGRVSFGGKLVT